MVMLEGAIEIFMLNLPIDLLISTHPHPLLEFVAST